MKKLFFLALAMFLMTGLSFAQENPPKENGPSTGKKEGRGRGHKRGERKGEGHHEKIDIEKRIKKAVRWFLKHKWHEMSRRERRHLREKLGEDRKKIMEFLQNKHKAQIAKLIDLVKKHPRTWRKHLRHWMKEHHRTGKGEGRREGRREGRKGRRGEGRKGGENKGGENKGGENKGGENKGGENKGGGESK